MSNDINRYYAKRGLFLKKNQILTILIIHKYSFNRKRNYPIIINHFTGILNLSEILCTFVNPIYISYYIDSMMMSVEIWINAKVN